MPEQPGEAAGMIQPRLTRVYNHPGEAAGMIQAVIPSVLFGRKLPPSLL
jgi:hypothetical protein